jgi:mRNA-degrading endonuclease RelE of RelBE toxin-antitoxin system
MYKVLVDKRVEKQISSLHPRDQKKVITAIDTLPEIFPKTPPPRRLKKLVGEPNAWRLRVGKTRILFYQNKSAGVLEIYKVGYRGGAYR